MTTSRWMIVTAFGLMSLGISLWWYQQAGGLAAEDHAVTVDQAGGSPWTLELDTLCDFDLTVTNAGTTAARVISVEEL